MLADTLPPQFVNYRLSHPKSGKAGKFPCCPRGYLIDPNNPKHWLDYATAASHATYEKLANSRPFGVAFVLTASDPYFFLDLDKCRNEKGEWTNEAKEIYSSFHGAAVEVSVSGSGLHIMGKCRCELLKDRRNKWDGWKEFYTEKRIVAFGPRGWQQIGSTLVPEFDWTDRLLKLVPEREQKKPREAKPSKQVLPGTNDDALVGKMFLASGNATTQFGGKASIPQLWNADPQLAKFFPPADHRRGGFDHSSADQSLMNHLAFWTNKDREQMERLFRRSNLMREKFERNDYREGLIMNALASVNKGYDPNWHDKKRLNSTTEWEPLPKQFTDPQIAPAPTLATTAFLPTGLANWVEEAAAAKSAPVDYVVFALLTAAASLIGNARMASPHPGWKETTALWVMCIGYPSAGKSPALDTVLDIMRDIEAPLQKAVEKELIEWENSQALAKMVEDNWKTRCKDAIQSGSVPPPAPEVIEEPPKPNFPRLLINDATVEKIAILASNQPKGSLVFWDELSGWLQSFSRYSGGNDRPFWLQAYGGRRYTVDRVGRDTIIIDRLTLSVLGGIQPDKLKSLMIDGDDDGLLQRFIPIWPDPVPLVRDVPNYSDAIPTHVLRKLQELNLQASGDLGPVPKLLPLCKSARDELYVFRARNRSVGEEVSGLMATFRGKMDGLVVRLSLIHAYVHWGECTSSEEPSEITQEDVSAAIALVERYILPMAERSYAAFSTSRQMVNAITLSEVIKAEGWLEFSQRDLHRKLGKRVTSAKELSAVLYELTNFGVLRDITEETASQGGRPSKRYEVNPHLYL